MLFPKHIRRKLSRLRRAKAGPEKDAAPAEHEPRCRAAAPLPPKGGVLDDISRKRLRARLNRRADEPSETRAPSGEEPPLALEAELSGELYQTGFGPAYRILRRADEWCDWASQVQGRLAETGALLARHFQGAQLSSLAFLDVETAGLSNAPLFLTGFLYFDQGLLRVEQVLARTYPEEPAVLARTAEALRERPCLVTYNGRSFDIPFIADRLVYHLMPPLGPHDHLDLLPPARRRFKRRFGDCKLQTLERAVCGRQRSDDIPGEQIPAAYHRFVASGDAREMVRICYHNVLDLLTMAELIPHLL